MDSAQSPNISPELLEQHPLVALALSAFLMLFALLVVGSLTSWIFLLSRAFRGVPVLVVETWKPRVWGLVDLIFAGGMIYFWQYQFATVGSRWLGINRQALTDENSLPLSFVTLLGVGNLAAMLSIVLWIMVRHQTNLTQVGFGIRAWGKHLAIGVVAAVAVLPLVYALMAVVSIGMDNTYKHPLLEAMKSDGSMNAYLLAVVSAALIAPVVEEFLFRVLLQGWLQSWQTSSLKTILFGTSEASIANSANFALAGTSIPLIDADESALASPLTPTITRPDNPEFEESTAGNLVPPLWPAIVTGILFGLAHLGYGLSFIPLIVLGIILGLLYRATHSIWPSLMVHFILNSSSMIALGVGVLIESIAKK